MLVKSRKFLGEATDIQKNEVGSGDADTTEIGFAMSPLVAAEQTDRAYNADEMTFSNIAGVLPTVDKVRFERMLYRATRGNCYVRFSALNRKALDASGKYIDKSCFIIFYKSAAIETKIKRICDAFGANRYNLSDLNRPRELEEQQQRNYREMEDAKTVLDKNTERKLQLCIEVADSLEEWLWTVRREKGVYHTLNLFSNDVASNLLRGRGWILKKSFNKAAHSLKQAHISMNLAPNALFEVLPANFSNAPTHFHTNKFTYAFQEFVNTYGTPRYKEINPALFTAATFPFLFGVMYGDIGHGSILALGGLYLIITEANAESRSMDEMLKGLYTARYMLFGMGICGLYAGLIYNDYFSIGLSLFKTNYLYTDQSSGVPATMLSAYGDASAVYPFGVDPAWKISSNDLLFYNSMKMKMSVILGIIQMIFGICLRGKNSLFDRNYVDFIFEFLPMIIFAVAFFGYMVILIFVKWSIDWNQRMAMGSCSYDVSGMIGACDVSTQGTCYTVTGATCTAASTLVDVCPLDYGGTGDGCQPPNLITTLINIALSPGYVIEPMFAGQAGLQTAILLIAFLCVPWLLVLKPLYLRRQHNQQQHETKAAMGSVTSDSVESPLYVKDGNNKSTHAHIDEDPNVLTPGSVSKGHGGHGHGGEFNFGEIFIHQAIETIEFVLGMVSNTASYLRLWALSLAHTELATVFWEKAMVSAIDLNNPVMIFIAYAIFAAVTFSVLLCMDVLECFLHALRLHWVEFQNKFFKADGYKFQPFDFRAILEKALLE